MLWIRQVPDSEMLVDEYEQYHNDRTDEVVVSRSGSEDPEPEPLADDRKTLAFPSFVCSSSHARGPGRHLVSRNPRGGVAVPVRSYERSFRQA